MDDGRRRRRTAEEEAARPHEQAAAPSDAAAAQLTRLHDDHVELHTPAGLFASWPEIVAAVGDEIARLSSSERGEQGGLGRDLERFTRIVTETVDGHPAWNIAPHRIPQLVALLRQEFFELGVIGWLLRLPELEEILCNRFDEVFVIVGGKTLPVQPSPFARERDVINFLTRVFAPQGVEINQSQPAADGQLASGERIHADIPPIARRGACFAIRKPRTRIFTMAEYRAAGMFSDEFADDLRRWVHGQYNILVSGGTSSGKTTFLNALGPLLPQDDRILVIEDSPELQLKTSNYVPFQAAGLGARAKRDSDTAITTRDLLRYALRLRPDRIIIGEVRDHTAYDLLQALNTGHDGSMTTLHANSAVDALSRMEALAVSARELDAEAIQEMIARTVDIVVQVGRFKGTDKRKVLEVVQVIHPEKVAEEGRAALASARQHGLRHLRGKLYALPLYQRDAAGELVRVNQTVPVIGKRLPD